jgi:glycosyltransferase involved in cell wall biosynthesis
MDIKVSILIPCYNAEKWISQAIESALNQTYHNKEVIVVDDGSTDNSLEVIKSFGDQIHWETGENKGGNVSRNRLLELSTGEWLQYLDSDDYLLETKIEQQINYLKNNPNIDIIYSPSIFEYWTNETSKKEILAIPEPHDPYALLALWHLPQTGSPLWKKQAIINAGGWKKDQPCCQEHELYLRLLKTNATFQYYEGAESVYRQWSESTVCKKDKSLTYKHRLQIIDDLEKYLQANHLMNQRRLDAINESRFACARLIWLVNRQWANNIITTIHASDSNFLPPQHLAPSIYKFIYKFLGFEVAEIFAKIKRALKS